jgi:hypothetical protein
MLPNQLKPRHLQSLNFSIPPDSRPGRPVHTFRAKKTDWDIFAEDGITEEHDDGDSSDEEEEGDERGGHSNGRAGPGAEELAKLVPLLPRKSKDNKLFVGSLLHLSQPKRILAKRLTSNVSFFLSSTQTNLTSTLDPSASSATICRRHCRFPLSCL